MRIRNYIERVFNMCSTLENVFSRIFKPYAYVFWDPGDWILVKCLTHFYCNQYTKRDCSYKATALTPVLCERGKLIFFLNAAAYCWRVLAISFIYKWGFISLRSVISGWTLLTEMRHLGQVLKNADSNEATQP
jgi:hypothetical protein